MAEHAVHTEFACTDEDIDRVAESARKGDRDAWRQLVQAILPRLAAFFRKLTKPGTDVDNLVGETLKELVRAIARYDASKPFDRFLFGIASMVLRRHFRANRRNLLPVGFNADVSDETTSEADRLEREELRKAIQDCMMLLGEVEKKIVVLRFTVQLRFNEIARLLETTSSAVRSRLFRAEKSLRKCLEMKGIERLS